jgi:hypothetical protein
LHEKKDHGRGDGSQQREQQLHRRCFARCDEEVAGGDERKRGNEYERERAATIDERAKG